MSTINEEVKSNHYISGPQFYKIVCEYYKACEDVESFDGDKESAEYKKLLRIQKRCLDKCGHPLLQMITGLSKKANFSGYTWKDEMMADAQIKCVRALVGRKFKPEIVKEDGTIIKYNPFSYFNRIAWREFLHRNSLEMANVKTRNKYATEHRGDFAEGDDTPIYIKPNLMSQLGEFWKDEYQVLQEDDE